MLIASLRPIIMQNTKSHNFNYIILKLSIVIIIIFSTKLLFANDAFYAKGYIVKDLKLNLNWLRCTVGQVWNNDTCEGTAIKLTMDDAKAAIKIAEEQLGGKWRLPNRKELENLVCMHCGKVKINKKYFPNTPYEPFWTGEKNEWSKNFFWSVNFFTGHTFGRFPGRIPNFVRLIKVE